MPCGSLAVQTALLQANVAQELIGSPELAELFRLWLYQVTGRETILKIADDYVRNHSESVKGDQYLTAYTSDYAVSMTLSAKNGLRVADFGNTGIEVERIEAYVTALAQAAAQERLVQTIASQYRITQDEPLSNGMRTLELEL